jgi:DNA-binding GntR family transcriptional regulator
MATTFALDMPQRYLMRSEIERQGIDLAEAAEQHRSLLEAVENGDTPRLRVAVRDHYLAGFPGYADGS